MIWGKWMQYFLLNDSLEHGRQNLAYTAVVSIGASGTWTVK